MAVIKLDKEPIYDYVNGENLFLLDKNELCSTISMYNQNLEKVQTYGQENPLLQFFFSPKNYIFLVSSQYFIFNELIYEDFTLKQLYLDKFLITFNDETCFLKCYNFKGDLLHKINLDKKLEGSLIGVINKELCFELDHISINLL